MGRRIAAALLVLSACGPTADPLGGETPVDVIDATNLGGLMLSVADPEESVTYFRSALAKDPGRTDFKRGLAISLARTGRSAEAAAAYRTLVADPGATAEDRLGYAETLARNNDWTEVDAQLAGLSTQGGGYRLTLLRAMRADQAQQWDAADRDYAAARALAAQPAPVLNNWGVSRMSRGDYPGAEQAFSEAIVFDPSLFGAKNNLAIVRGLQGKFTLPVVPLTEEERAILLHNLALVALRRNEIALARGLLEEAVATHPRHFEPAVAKLAALSGVVVR